MSNLVSILRHLLTASDVALAALVDAYVRAYENRLRHSDSMHLCLRISAVDESEFGGMRGVEISQASKLG